MLIQLIHVNKKVVGRSDMQSTAKTGISVTSDGKIGHVYVNHHSECRELFDCFQKNLVRWLVK